MCDARGSRDVSDVSRRQAASVHVPARLTSVDFMQTLAAWAQDLARTLLADALPRRWSHVQGVAARARSLAPVPRPGRRSARGRRVAARHRLPPRTRRHRPARPGRRPLPPRRPARRTHAVPPGRAPLLRRHRGRRTRPRPHPDPRVRPAAAAAGRRADLLRHDHQPRRRARPGNTTAWPRSTTATARATWSAAPSAAPPRSSWRPSARSTQPHAPRLHRACEAGAEGGGCTVGGGKVFLRRPGWLARLLAGTGDLDGRVKPLTVPGKAGARCGGNPGQRSSSAAQ